MTKLKLKTIALLLTAILLISGFTISANSKTVNDISDDSIFDNTISHEFNLMTADEKDEYIRTGNVEVHKPTIDEDFKNYQFKVILRHNYSEVNSLKTIADFNVREESVSVVKEGLCGNEPVIGTFKKSDILEITDSFRVDDPENNPLFNKEHFNQLLTVKLKTPGKENVLAAIEAFEKLDSVLAAEPDYNYLVEDYAVPNDTHYPNQTNLPKINYEAAWDYLINNNWATTVVNVGILEAGIDGTHEDLNGGIIAGNQVNTGDLTHGTRVARVLGARTDNNKIGIAGVGNGRSNRNNIKIACAHGDGSSDLIKNIHIMADMNGVVLQHHNNAPY